MNLLTGAIAAFRTQPQAPAVTDDGGTLTWSEFLGEVKRLTMELTRSSDHGPVGLLLPSDRSFLTVFLAAAAVGRPACPLHPDWADPELEAAITDVGLQSVFTDRKALPGGVQVEQAPSGRTDPDGSVTGPFSIDQVAGQEDLEFYIGFTSGTSGRPKPFVRRTRSWTTSFAPAGEMFSVGSGDRVYLPGSLQHSHFLFGAMLALHRGAEARLFERFDVGRLVAQLRDEHRGVLYLVPTMLLALVETETEPFPGIHSVVLSGAKLEGHHWTIVRRLFPQAKISECYGASELSFVTVNSEGELPDEPGYVGRPFPGVELEIRGEEGATEDGTGEVFVRSPYLFDRYLDDSIASPIGADGFMTVGDLGRVSGDRLALVGRASNLLITGGKNVHPEEVERELTNHPTVVSCVVVGLPHPRWGDQLVAFVEPAPGASFTADELRDHLRPRLAAYKIPKRWFRVDRIPETPAKKTDRTPERLLESATEIQP